MTSREGTSALAVRRSGSGRRLVLVHGFTQSSESWRRIGDALSVRYEVLAPDLPGHGRSSDPEGGLDEAGRLLGEAGGRGTYVGYSLGGRVCLHLALQSPELVERLVLVSATAGIEEDEHRRQRRESDDSLAARIEDLGEVGLPVFLDEWLAGPLFSHLDDAAKDLAVRCRNRPHGLAASLRCHGTGTQEPLWDRLGELAMEVVVVAGADDDAYAAIGRRMAASVGDNARFLLMPGAGHAVPFEQPDGFVRLLEGVLDPIAGLRHRDTP